VLTSPGGKDQTVRMVTATEVSFLTVALYLFDLAIKVVALGLVPEDDVRHQPLLGCC
jgi:hypothetical protein